MKNTKMLKKNNEFKYVFLNGKYYKEKYLEVFFLKNNLETNKLGLAISKKIGKSVVRNRIRRLIKENYRLKENSIKKGYTFVFLWNKNCSIELATFDNIKRDMEILLEKVDVLIK